MIEYYFLTLLLLAGIPMNYVVFRFGFEPEMKRKRGSKKRARKLKDRKLSHWWSNYARKTNKRGWMCYLNTWLVVLYPVTLGLAVILGWNRLIAPMISVLFGIMALMQAVLCFCLKMQINTVCYGTPIVWYAQDNLGAVDSIITDLCLVSFPLLAAWAQITLMMDAFFSG